MEKTNQPQDTWQYANPKAGLADHIKDIQISNGLLACFDIPELASDCCKTCDYDEEGWMDFDTISTKHGNVEFHYCCKHSFLKQEKKGEPYERDEEGRRKLIEKFLDGKYAEWGVKG